MAGLRADVCVIAPAFNEQKNIGGVVRGILAQGFPMLVVDDGSVDDTSAVAKSAGAEVLVLATNGGKGAALRRGIEWFLSKDYETLIIMDADGQHDPRELDVFLKALRRENAGMAVGDRMQDPQGMPLERRLTNRLMSRLISFLARQAVPDSQCGYRAATRDVLRKMQLRTDRYEIETEMILEAAKNGFKIVSVPIRSVYSGGKSQIRPLPDTARFLKFLFDYLIKRK